MKTVGFYSYKGGTGKSLAAANFALLLSRLGINSVLVDLDVDSPSLHNKFRSVGKTALGVDGFVGLIRDNVRPKGESTTSGASHAEVTRLVRDCWDRHTLTNVTFVENPQAEDCVYPIPAQWAKKLKGAQTPGTIHLLPAGQIQGEDYWPVIWSPLWHQIFTAYDLYSKDLLPRNKFEAVGTFLASIKTSLGQLDPAPEYLILDFRSGASELSSTLINAWVDKLVYLFAFNSDSISYFQETLAKVDTETLEIIPVLSRIPKELEFFQGDSELQDALSSMEFSVRDLFPLHSDRGLEILEQLRLGYNRTPQNRRLTHDYLRLFAKLIVGDPDKESEYVETLENHLGLDPNAVEDSERTFSFQSACGALINPHDDSRNVAFKVKTFQLLLEGVASGLEPGQPLALERSTLTSVLDAAGFRCGETFGSDLNKKFRRKRLNYAQKVENWCEFDSDVGFGRLDLDPDATKTDGQTLLACDIWLHESFLTPADDTELKGDAHPYCEFMSGYIRGVLSKILRDSVVVTHDSAGPKTATARSQSCIFRVRLKQDSPLGKKENL